MARDTLPAIKFTQKAQLIEALEARRPWAEQYDATRLAAHQNAEKEALAKVRSRCREVLKMSYEEICDEDRRSFRSLVEIDRPDCPSSAVDLLDRVLDTLTYTHQETFTISEDDHRTARIHHLLTYDETKREAMC